ncbi:MAG: ABC transporter substrate-binding protein, partial [bacterium]
ANNIKAKQVTIENVGFPVREPMLAAGEVDAITGFSFSSFLNLKSKGVKEEDINVMLMSDYGLKLYGNTVIVNPDFAAENPQLVKGFVRAIIRGWMDTIADPNSAIDHLMERNKIARRNVELERLEMAIRDNVITAEVKERGFGDVEGQRLSESINQVGLTYDFSNKPTAASVFTSEFLPAMSQRKVN